MKWKISTIQRLKAIGALALVFLLVLATNMMDNNHFALVKRTLATVYEDRLVAKDYIYRISNELQHKQIAWLNAQENQQLEEITTAANDSINALLGMYSTTRLTDKEAKYFKVLKSDLADLEKFEADVLSNSKTVSDGAVKDYYAEIDKHLHELAVIQLKEGKRQIHMSNQAIENSDLISKLEIGVLIIIGIVIQVLIFFRPQRTENE